MCGWQLHLVLGQLLRVHGTVQLPMLMLMLPWQQPQTDRLWPIIAKDLLLPVQSATPGLAACCLALPGHAAQLCAASQTPTLQALKALVLQLPPPSCRLGVQIPHGIPH